MLYNGSICYTTFFTNYIFNKNCVSNYDGCCTDEDLLWTIRIKIQHNPHLIPLQKATFGTNSDLSLALCMQNSCTLRKNYNGQQP